MNRQAFEDYITKKGYEGIHALVAFSGKVKLNGEEKEYTEACEKQCKGGEK